MYWLKLCTHDMWHVDNLFPFSRGRFQYYWYRNDFPHIPNIAINVISWFFVWTAWLSIFAFIINKLFISYFVLCNQSLKSVHKYACLLWWNEVPGDNGSAVIIVLVPVYTLYITRVTVLYLYCLIPENTLCCN